MFHEDAEVRPFYTFLGKFIRRARGAQSGWQRGDPAYTLFESIIISMSYQNAAHITEIGEKEFCSYVDFFLERCMDE